MLQIVTRKIHEIIQKTKLKRMVFVLFGSFLVGLIAVQGTAASAKESNPYYIKVNKQQNCITIYEKDEDGAYTVPIKAITCSAGWATPLGTFNTLQKYRWKLLMGDVWGQYSTRIVKGVLFHSVWYYEKDPSTLSWKQFNKLGTLASHGCIRITVQDAKWIYDNCPVGTTVEIYNSKDPGPLGKPETLQLKAGTGWDPTDPDENNPFLKKKPAIKGAKDKTVEWGTKIDLLKGITATSTTGTDITSKIKIKGKVDIYTAGKYKVKYYVTDAIGRSKTKTITITVKQPELQPVLEGVRDRYVNEDTMIDRTFALEGVTAYVGTDQLSQKDIQVEIIQENDDRYTVQYSVTTDKNQRTVATATVIIDRNAPVFTGVEHREITLEELESGEAGIKNLALEGVSVSDDYSNLTMDDVKVSVRAKEDYAFLITYETEDEVGNFVEETVQFTYFQDARIQGIANYYNIPYGTDITKDYVKQGITATNGKGDITDQIKIKISGYAGGIYKVTYYVTNGDGSTLSVVAYFYVEEEE